MVLSPMKLCNKINMKNTKCVFFVLVLFVFLVSGCSENKLSPDLYYNMGDLRARKSDDGVKLFSFFIDDEFVEVDKSRRSKTHFSLTNNQVSLLSEHLSRRGYCLNGEDEVKFRITGKQNPVYQEIPESSDGKNKINIIPTGFFGQCK